MIDAARRGVKASLAALVFVLVSSAVVFSDPRLVLAGPATPGDAPSSLRLDIRTSAAAAKTGDRVAVDVTVTNASARRLRNVTVFLGLVDLHPGEPTPLGLETWTNDPESMALSNLDPGASATARWHLVMFQPGPLGIYASAVPEVAPGVDSSEVTRVMVRDARVLNPAHVLPLAVGEPVALAAVLAAVAILRAPARLRRTRQPRSANGWTVIVIAAGIIFLGLPLTAKFGGVSALEREVYFAVLDETADVGKMPFRLMNHLGDVWGLVPIGLVVVAAAPSEVCARWWLRLGTMLGAGTLEILGKSFVERPRPRGPAFGFPSGPVTAAAAFFVMVGYLVAKAIPTRAGKAAAWALAAPSIVLIAIARIALHTHWPLDVIGGAALGVACGGAAAWWSAAHPRG